MAKVLAHERDDDGVGQVRVERHVAGHREHGERAPGVGHRDAGNARRRQSSSSLRTAANSSCTGAHIGHVVMIVEVLVAGSGQLIVVPCTSNRFGGNMTVVVFFAALFSAAVAQLAPAQHAALMDVMDGLGASTRSPFVLG